MVAALVLRFGLAYALTFTLHRYISMPGGTKMVSGAFLGFLASYLKVIPAAGFQAGHPTMVVGDTVRYAEARRERRHLRVQSRRPSQSWFATGAVSEREWVYDVSLEGVQLVPAADREGSHSQPLGFRLPSRPARASWSATYRDRSSDEARSQHKREHSCRVRPNLMAGNRDVGARTLLIEQEPEKTDNSRANAGQYKRCRENELTWFLHVLMI
jgi:hypothetical protein